MKRSTKIVIPVAIVSKKTIRQIVVGRPVMIWTGSNLKQVVSRIFEIDTEIRLQVRFCRLILSAPERGFHRSFGIGEMIEILENNIIIDDEIIEPAPPIVRPAHIDSPETLRMMAEWGLGLSSLEI